MQPTADGPSFLATLDRVAERLFSRSVEDGGPRGHPDPHRTPQVLLVRRESHERLRGKAAGHSVQTARDGVLLVQEGRHAESTRGHYSGRARVAPDPEHSLGSQFFYYAFTGEDGPEGEEGCAGLGQGISGETSQGEGVEGVAFARDQGAFDAG